MALKDIWNSIEWDSNPNVYKQDEIVAQIKEQAAKATKKLHWWLRKELIIFGLLMVLLVAALLWGNNSEIWIPVLFLSLVIGLNTALYASVLKKLHAIDPQATVKSQIEETIHIYKQLGRTQRATLKMTFSGSMLGGLLLGWTIDGKPLQQLWQNPRLLAFFLLLVVVVALVPPKWVRYLKSASVRESMRKLEKQLRLLVED